MIFLSRAGLLCGFPYSNKRQWILNSWLHFTPSHAHFHDNLPPPYKISRLTSGHFVNGIALNRSKIARGEEYRDHLVAVSSITPLGGPRFTIVETHHFPYPA
ncbi:hypothetical protein Naga_100033g19 [Nannochloropsis gaditana]|uniref:Uncharacterized protein n=1 Tax=Nannochloropsis gaditana TaxID=72520 RepID=W7UCQ9_9STRA|nr:hypothetical protein Naga_100033g19 [Nannochloropsis gaditana]